MQWSFDFKFNCFSKWYHLAKSIIDLLTIETNVKQMNEITVFAPENLIIKKVFFKIMSFDLGSTGICLKRKGLPCKWEHQHF